MSLGHQEHLWRKLQGVHRTGSIPNNEKRAKLPAAWLASAFTPDGAAEFASKHDLGAPPAMAAEFAAFFDARRAAMKAKLLRLLEVTPAAQDEAA